MNLKQIEQLAEHAAKKMSPLELGESIGRLKSEIAVETARLRGYQSALKVKLNQNPVVAARKVE